MRHEQEPIVPHCGPPTLTSVSLEEHTATQPKALGRRVRFNGITISRFENGLIVEDWSVTDTLGMLRQVGLWRCVVIGARSLSTLTK